MHQDAQGRSSWNKTGRDTDVSQMKKKYIIFRHVSVLDDARQITKWLVARILYGERIPVIGGIFDLCAFPKYGAAFGIFSGLSGCRQKSHLFVIAAAAAACGSLSEVAAR